MKLNEFGPLVGMAARAAGAAVAGKVADKVMGEDDEWEEEPINSFGAAEELDDIDPAGQEVDAIGSHDAEEDVSELIATIDHIQGMGMSMSDRHYDIEKLMNMRPEMIKRIYDKVKGTVDEARDEDEESHRNYRPEPDDFEENKGDYDDEDYSPGTWIEEEDDVIDVGDEIDGLDAEPEVEVPAAAEVGASMDISDMLGKIAYMQDMGMSLSDRHYDTEKLMMMKPEMVQRIYRSVVGESKQESNDTFISTIKESKKTKPAINEGADEDVVRALKALFD